MVMENKWGRRPNLRLVGGDTVEDGEPPSVNLPFTLTLGGRVLTGCGISLTTARVAMPAGELPIVGNTQSAQIRFPFEDFDVSIYPVVRVQPHTENDTIVLRFTDPDGPHRTQLRYIVNSHLAGDIVTLGGMLRHTAQARQARTEAETTRRSAYFWPAVAAVPLLVLAVAGAADSNAVAPVGSAVIAQPTQGLHAQAAGQLVQISPDAGRGETAFSVLTADGKLVGQMNPCDCSLVVPSDMSAGTEVLPGDLVLTATADTAAPTLYGPLDRSARRRAEAGER
ncbi:MAG: hypothetical protein AAFV62_04330, partial [Pseudomonadota bacterium]